jgi:hypothetical protein
MEYYEEIGSKRVQEERNICYDYTNERDGGTQFMKNAAYAGRQGVK